MPADCHMVSSSSIHHNLDNLPASYNQGIPDFEVRNTLGIQLKSDATKTRSHRVSRKGTRSRSLSLCPSDFVANIGFSTALLEGTLCDEKLSRGNEIDETPDYASREVNPSRTANFVRFAMLSIFSFSMIWLRCVSTVLTLILSAAATCFVDFPSANS